MSGEKGSGDFGAALISPPVKAYIHYIELGVKPNVWIVVHLNLSPSMTFHAQ
jgi:hypothetical protein